MFTLQKTSFYYCSCTWSMHCGLATGSLHISSWFYFKCPGSCTKVIYCPITSSVMLKVIIPSNLWRQLLNCQNIRKSHYRLSHLLTADWKLLNVLSDKLVFPSVIAITRLRADILLFHTSIKTVDILEFTCPCEENVEEWHQKNFFKYDPFTT